MTPETTKMPVITPGAKIWTNYDTGPYIIVEISELCTCMEYLASLELGYGDEGVPSEAHYHLVVMDAEPRADIGHLVLVFREVRRTMAKTGTLWLNLGDTYAASGRGGNPTGAAGGHVITIEQLLEYFEQWYAAKETAVDVG